MKFTKMTGLGNDYIYINCIEERELGDIPELSKKLSNRHFGIGADGIILIDKSDIADFKMRIFNCDGSEAEMCGNGIRCVGKYVYDKGLTKNKEITVETLGGIKTLNLFPEEKNDYMTEIGEIKGNDKIKNVEVDMGEPEFKSLDLPIVEGEEIAKDIDILVGDKIYRFTAVSMGNPHVVTFVEDITLVPIEKVGPEIENNEIFPHKTNVEFVEVVDQEHIKMRVWERGSKETYACGTGACAAVVASGVNGYTKPKVDVELLGGNLQIKWGSNNHIYMTGPAQTVFEGEIV